MNQLLSELIVILHELSPKYVGINFNMPNVGDKIMISDYYSYGV